MNLAAVRYALLAKADLTEVRRYSRSNWGDVKAREYLYGLRACCEMLGEFPLMGRVCDEAGKGRRRMEHGEHVVFYRQLDHGIRVLRILHKSRLPNQAVFVE